MILRYLHCTFHPTLLSLTRDFLFTILPVYVLITDNFATVDFAVHMHKKGLLDNGDYIIISVDQEVYNPNVERQFIDRGI